jgi:transposase
MAYFYIGANRNQTFLMPVDMRDWLEEGHLAFFMIDVVDRVDTSAFHALHPNDGPVVPPMTPR